MAKAVNLYDTLNKKKAKRSILNLDSRIQSLETAKNIVKGIRSDYFQVKTMLE